MALPAAFDPIVNAPKYQKLLLGVFGLAIMIGVAYFVWPIPAVQQRVEELRAQNESLRRDVAQHRIMVADLARVRAEMAELERRLDSIKEKLPSEREIPPLYRTLSDAAYQAGLGVSLFQPREARIRDFYSEIPITVQAEGGYHQVGEFLERVAGLPRIVTVDEIKLTGLARGRTPVRADLTLATYIYRPVGSPPAPKQPGAPR